MLDARTAPEMLRAWLVEVMGPFLRRLGLVGRDRIFQFRDPDLYACLGFQGSSAASTDEAALFTVNACVVSHRVWAERREVVPYLPVTPTPNVDFGDWMWQRRVGDLLGGGGDLWWQISRTNPDPMPCLRSPHHRSGAWPDDIYVVIRDYVVPAMRAELGRAG